MELRSRIIKDTLFLFKEYFNPLLYFFIKVKNVIKKLFGNI